MHLGKQNVLLGDSGLVSTGVGIFLEFRLLDDICSARRFLQVENKACSSRPNRVRLTSADCRSYTETNP
jgi:hypothetical protein